MKHVLLLFSLLILRGLLPSLDAQTSALAIVNERGINTAFQDYSPAFYRNGLVFIAANPAVGKDKKQDEQNGKFTTSIFFAARSKDGTLQRPQPFAEELTTRFYDGPLTFNAAGDVVYFTRSNIKHGKPKPAKDGTVKLKIYTATLSKSGNWAGITEMPFCTDESDFAHPSVSADGKRLYFASNRPGGQGGMDLYVVLQESNGKWSEPVNLGPKINTKKDDVFPFIAADGTLFFATNGRKAIGGLDIFSSKKMSDGWLEPQLLPEPLNSPSDDFGIILTDDKMSGYFSSNRSSGQGDDDIFSFGGLSSADFNREKPSVVSNDFDEKPVQVIDNQSVGTSKMPIIADNNSKQKVEKPVPPTAPILDNNVKQKVEKPTAPFAPKVNPKMEGKEGKPNTSVVVNNPPKANNPPNLKSSTSSPEPQNGVSTSENTEGSSDKSGKIEVRIFALEKGTNGSISGAKVSVVDMNLIQNSLVVTDASGKIIGLRTEHGDALSLETLQKLEETTDATGKITVQLPSGNRFLFNFTKTGFEPKFILKTVLPNDSKIVAFLSALPKAAVTTTKALRTSRDTTPPTIYYRESVRVRADNFDDQAQFTANENVGSSDKTSVSSSDGFTFELKKIYYDYGDSEVNADAKLELEPLIDLMLRHREVEIEIASHTDSRGKAPFNLNLSQQRADNLKVYLTERGIRASRIRAVGYGETQLKNGCVDGVNCSEEDHAKNRRTEIRILKGAETERINEQHLNESKPPKPVKTTKAGNDTEGVNFYADASTQPAKLAADASAHRWFMVVIGTFTKPDNAALQRQKALDAGFEDAELVQYQDNALYGVCVRKYNNEKEAKSLVERINEAKQFEAFVKELK